MKNVISENDMREMADALKKYRAITNITQEECAKQFNTSRYTIMKLESCKRTSWQQAYKVYAKLLLEMQHITIPAGL